MKGCAITALIFAVVGMVCAMVGGRMAGNIAIAQAVEQATKGKVRVDSNGFGGWGFHSYGKNLGSWILRLMDFDIDSYDEATRADLDEIVDHGYEEGQHDHMEEYGDDMQDDRGQYGGYMGQYDDEHEVEFSDERHVFSGDVERFCPGNNIRELEIDIGGCSFDTLASPDDKIYLEASGMYRFQGYVEDDTLHVISVGRTPANVEDGMIHLYLPEGYRFHEVEAELGAGVMYFGDLYADSISLEVGAGEITVESARTLDLEVNVGAGNVNLFRVETDELDVEVGLGAFTADAVTIGREADVECAMGSVEMFLEGREQDFNYQLECAMGSIDLGPWSYTGLGQEKDINNGASRQIDLECSMGYINMQFTEG